MCYIVYHHCVVKVIDRADRDNCFLSLPRPTKLNTREIIRSKQRRCTYWMVGPRCCSTHSLDPFLIGFPGQCMTSYRNIYSIIASYENTVHTFATINSLAIRNGLYTKPLSLAHRKLVRYTFSHTRGPLHMMTSARGKTKLTKQDLETFSFPFCDKICLVHVL